MEWRDTGLFAIGFSCGAVIAAYVMASVICRTMRDLIDDIKIDDSEAKK